MRITIVIALALSAAGLSGCVSIQPWERERLAASDMQFGGGGEMESAEAHATEVREGSAGGFDAGGGGCGCN